ncbi:MAG: hypothetical protein P1U34_07455 [Coxiellaceae bacterium]|nr:hypothetical protein [Coxiellaceae bacterium]
MTKIITHSTPTRRQLGRYVANTFLLATAATVTVAATYMFSQIFRVTADDIWHSQYAISLNSLTSPYLMFRLDPELVATEANAVTPDCHWLIKQSAQIQFMHHSDKYLKDYHSWKTILPRCEAAMNVIHKFVTRKMGDHLALIHNGKIAGYVTGGVLGLLSLAQFAQYKLAPKPTVPLQQVVIEPALSLCRSSI